MFKEKNEIQDFYRKIKYGESIRVVRDLSDGKLLKNMIQEMEVKIYPENKKAIYEILMKFPILVLEIQK